MSNSNTRRRKRKKQQRGIQQGLAFAALRATGKSRVPVFIFHSGTTSAKNYDKVWFEEA